MLESRLTRLVIDDLSCNLPILVADSIMAVCLAATLVLEALNVWRESSFEIEAPALG